MKKTISYPRLILTAFILFLIQISPTSLYAQVDWIYSNQEVKDYLIENDPAINASNVSEEMLEIIKSNHTGAMADLQFVILRDSQLDILSVFSPTEPPDYGAAGKIVIDFGLPVINELASWAGYFNPFSSGVISSATTFRDIASYAGWLYFNQDLIFVNNQIQYYFHYKAGSSDPFADYGIIGPGYLYPPAGMNYGGVYEPLHPEIYTVDRVKQLAEAWYVYKQQHDLDYNRYRAEILSGVNSILQPMLEAYDEYASGALCKALVVGEQFIVVGNKGNFPMQNVVLVNSRIIGDQRTDPVDIDPGKNASIQPDFADIDYIEFEIFGAPVQLDFSAMTVSMIPLFSFEFADDPGYAPQLVTFRINPIPVGEPYSYHLDFGDGNSADGSSTGAVFESHTYSAPGSFHVSLTVSDSGTYSDTSSRIVTVENPVVAAYPLCSNNQGFAPFSIAFDASGSSCATGGDLSYHWDFGDSHEDSGISPDHTFDAGSFQVELTVSLTPEIFATSVQSVKIYNAANALSVTPSFQNVPSPGGTTTFGIANTGDGTMNWTAQVDPNDTWLTIVNGSFGTDDGIITIDCGANSGDARTGRITVTADNAENSPHTIEVRQAAAGFAVDFEASPYFGNSPLTVRFTDLSASENPITSWQWLFGDGGTSAEQNPLYTYQNPGTYNVTLSVSDGTINGAITKSSYIAVSSEPSAPDINIVAIEYFFDADPGFGNGISIPITSDNVVSIQTTIDMSDLSLGLHRLYVRAQDENGNWGIVQSKPVLVQMADGNDPLPNIGDVEYFFDNDPGYDNGSTLSLTPNGEVEISTNINASNLDVGLHRLYVRAKDENGNWGIVQSKPVLIQKTGSDTPLPNITNIEYFFDGDPGFGNGANLVFTPDVTVEIGTNLPLYSLALGDHRLYVRAQDENGLWGIAQFTDFSVEEAPDSDGDGYPDNTDTFPNDPNEWEDTDADGIGNNADADDDNDGMPDDWENTYGLNPLVDDSGDDFDNDEFTNLQEYQANTNPLDANSVPVTLDSLSKLFDFSWSDTSLDYNHEYESLYAIVRNCIADTNYTYYKPDGTIGVDSNCNSFIRTFAEEENPPIVYYMKFNDDGSFYSGWFFTPWIDASWGNDISKADDSFNTVYAAEPSDLKDDDNFEVISYIDEFSPLCGTDNLKSYFFTYDTKNDDNGSAVTFAQWLSYLADITSTSTYGRSIDTLTIFAHGDPGVVYMSQEFDLRNDEDTETYMKALKWNDEEDEGILSKNSTILLFSCNVGEGKDGKTFVQNLANWTGATVFANSVKTGDLLEKNTENGTLIIRDWELDVIAIPDYYFSSPDNELHSIPVSSDIDKTVMLPGGVLVKIEKGDLAEDGVLEIRNVFDQYSNDDNISSAYEITLTTQITDGNSILISIPYNSDLINLNESELTVKFWDDNSQQWFSEGIWDIQLNDNYVIFKTSHTTVFAVLQKVSAIPGDLDGDGDVDKDDLNIILSHRNQPATVCPECDLDGDGMITALDSRKLVLLCTRPRCACE